ncbi:MAG: type IX secretion system membrane protein PorP/SprF [Saprospiraceae bacterium]|nr:type IX secretion system membrane protein PorP/SprF [Saprospiraceae bacterium]
MKQFRLLLTLFGLFGGVAMAQQDPMFTKYMFNSLTYNPAYAGSNEHMSIGLIHRSQWFEIEGSPTTQTLTLHTPLQNNRVGLGASLMHDRIGPTSTIGLQVAYAYRIPLGRGTLAIGLQGGITNWRADWSKLDLENPNPDPAFSETPNYWMPNFGAGVYYSTRHFFAGFGSPHLVEYDLRRQNITPDYPLYARQYRHYFVSTGGAIPLNGTALIFRPMLLVKNVGWFSSLRQNEAQKKVKAPTEFDIDLSLLFFERFWLGTAFRSSFEAFGDNKTSSYDSVDLWASYFFTNGMRIGASYDYPLTRLRTVTSGAFEVMLGYEFNYKTKRIVTPRYF